MRGNPASVTALRTSAAMVGGQLRGRRSAPLIACQCVWSVRVRRTSPAVGFDVVFEAGQGAVDDDLFDLAGERGRHGHLGVEGELVGDLGVTGVARSEGVGALQAGQDAGGEQAPVHRPVAVPLVGMGLVIAQSAAVDEQPDPRGPTAGAGVDDLGGGDFAGPLR